MQVTRFTDSRGRSHRTPLDAIAASIEDKGDENVPPDPGDPAGLRGRLTAAWRAVR